MDKIFKAMADKNRRKILTILKEKEMPVNEILSYLTVTQATLSNHLSVLRKANLVSCKVAGKQRIYSINQEMFSGFIEKLNSFVNDKPEIKEFSSDIVIRGRK